MTERLYTDGGVVKVNPSPYGGTWAWVLTNDAPEYVGVDGVEGIVCCASGVIPPEWGVNGLVTNNVSELWAAVYALRAMPLYWRGTLCSDSQVTLGRLFSRWPLRGVPDHLVLMVEDIRLRLKEDLVRVDHTLLQGHPTRADLANGIGQKRGLPVSKWNVYVDQLCQEQARKVLV